MLAGDQSLGGGGETMELLSSSFEERAESFQRQTEIRLAGEQLRLRLHNAKLIRDRFRSNSTYPNSCLAKDVVDFLVKHKEAPDRETAISIMQKLVESNIIHHVCDKHSVFKDAKLLYRFRNDDGTFSPTHQMKIAVRSQRIYEIMISQENSILQEREEGSQLYRRTFSGTQMFDWLVNNGQVASRGDGEPLCRAMLEYGIIQPVSGHYPFSDSDRLFHFSINFCRRRKLIEVLNDPSQCEAHRPGSPDSPFCLRKFRSELPQSGFVVAGEPQPEPTPLKRSSLSGLESAVSYCHFSANKPPMELPSVLKAPVTVEELLAPGAPYIRKTLYIVSDDVGWGFVVRGTGPCHIQVVDHRGPAAAAGVKICQFIRSVNGINVLNVDCKTIYKHIVDGPRRLILEVLEPIEVLEPSEVVEPSD